MYSRGGALPLVLLGMAVIATSLAFRRPVHQKEPPLRPPGQTPFVPLWQRGKRIIDVEGLDPSAHPKGTWAPHSIGQKRSLLEGAPTVLSVKMFGGVPQSFIFVPQDWGTMGLKEDLIQVLRPQRSGIPLSRKRDLGGSGSVVSPDSSAHHGQASPCPCDASGRAEGRSPSAFVNNPPRLGDQGG